MCKYPPTKVAVLLAAYNGVGYIEQQIETILSQENVRLKLFISVDKSADGTFEWCHQLQNKNSNVHVLSYGEKFGGAAKNFFRLFRDVDFSEFDYVSLADQDDLWDSRKLAQAIEKIQTENASSYSGNVLAFWENGHRLLIEKSQPQREYDFLFEAAGPGCTYVISQKLANDFQQFLLNKTEANDFILHDWLLYAFARTKGYKWVIDSVSYMEYRQHEHNQVGVNNSFSAFWRRVKYVLWEGGLTQVKLLLNILPPNEKFQKWKGFSRKSIFNMMLHFNQFRRKPVERLYVLFTLFIALFKRAEAK